MDLLHASSILSYARENPARNPVLPIPPSGKDVRKLTREHLEVNLEFLHETW